MVVRDVDDANLPAVQAFLERHAETTLFLSSSLASFGPRRGDSMNSGNFKCLVAAGEVTGVFCLTGRGNILVETGGHTDHARAIVDSCRLEASPIDGVVGEWRAADAVWRVLAEVYGYVERYRSRELLYRLDLPAAGSSGELSPHVRLLTPADFERWAPLYREYTEEEGLPLQGTHAEQRASFEASAIDRRWWGYWQGNELLATVALNARHGRIGQVGGVYTRPAWRRRGLSRAAMHTLLGDCRDLHALRSLILFTGEHNLAARAMYEGLGFVRIGEFGLLFGAAPPAN